MARSTRFCGVDRVGACTWRNSSPWARTMSATSRAGRTKRQHLRLRIKDGIRKQIQRAGWGADRMGGQTKGTCRGGELAGTEGKLNFAQVGPGFQQMPGVGVSSRVPAGVLPQTSALAGMGNGLAAGLSAQRVGGNLSWEQPLLRAYRPPNGRWHA